MTTLNDTRTTTSNEDAGSYDNILGSIWVDEDGTLIFNTTDPGYVRTTAAGLKMDATQFASYMAALNLIVSKLSLIANRTGASVTTLTGAWTPGANTLVFARVEDQTVRFGFPTTGLVPIALSDFPGFGGAGDPYDILPVGHRPATGVTFTRDLVSVDRATDVDPAVRATAFVPILFIVDTDGGIYIISTDDDVVGLTLNAGLIKADVTFPLTIS